jgi:hypothetical protein
LCLQGGKAFHSTSTRVEQHVNCTDWHPTEPLLAIGWQSGIVMLVDPLKKQGKHKLTRHKFK